MTRAFPSSAVEVHLGMTLRDYFAGQALAGLTSAIPSYKAEEDGTPTDTINHMARASYGLADAMLAAREE